jgi:hypothetical protein
VQVLSSVRLHLGRLIGLVRDFVKSNDRAVVGIRGVARFLLVAGAIDETGEWLCPLQNVADCLLRHSN